MITNSTQKSLLVRAIILLSLPILFFSDVSAARRRSGPSVATVQKKATPSSSSGLTISPAAAAQIAELKAQMNRNAEAEKKEDAAEAREDEAERRKDESAEKEEAAREKRAAEYRKLLEVAQAGEPITVPPELMKPLDESQFQPKPVAQDWKSAEITPAVSSAIPGADVTGQEGMPEDDFGAMSADEFGTMPEDDFSMMPEDDFGAESVEEPDMMLEPETGDLESGMEMELPSDEGMAFSAEQDSYTPMEESIPGADIVSKDGAPLKRANLGLVLNLFDKFKILRITSVQLKTYREILEGKSSSDPQKNYAPAIYEETPDKLVQKFITELETFYNKTLDKAKVKAEDKAEFKIILGLALRTPKIVEVDTEKKLEGLQKKLKSTFYTDFRVAMKSKELIGPDARIPLLKEITDKVVAGTVTLDEKQLEYLRKGIVITRNKVDRADWKDEVQWKKIQSGYATLVTKAYNKGVGSIAKFDAEKKKKGQLKELAEELDRGFNFNAWYRRAMAKKLMGWKKKFDWRVPVFRQMVSKITANNSDKQVKAFTKALGYFRSKMSDMLPEQKILYKATVYSAMKNPSIILMDKKISEKLAQAKKVFETGFDFVAELKAAMKAKTLVGPEGKIDKFTKLTQKVLNPVRKIQLSELEKGYIIRGILYLKKKVFKDEASQQPYSKLVNFAYGDGTNLIAQQDVAGVKYSALKGKKTGKLKELKAEVGSGFYFDMLRSSAVASKTVTERITILYGMVVKILNPQYKITLSNDQAASLVKTIVFTKSKVDKEDPASVPGKEILSKFRSLITKAISQPIMAKVDAAGIKYSKLATKKKGRLSGFVAELAKGFNFDAWMNKVNAVSGNTLAKFNGRVPLFSKMFLNMTDKHTGDQKTEFLEAVTLKAFRKGYGILKNSANKTSYTTVLYNIKANPKLAFLYTFKPKYKERIDYAYPIFKTGFDAISDLDQITSINLNTRTGRPKAINYLNAFLPKLSMMHDADIRRKTAGVIRDLYYQTKKNKDAGNKVAAKALVNKALVHVALREFASTKFGSSSPKRLIDVAAIHNTW